MKYTYLAIDLGAISVPFIASFHPLIKFYKSWSLVIISMLVSGSLFIGWDIWFTHAGIWGFNPDYISGIYCFNLPLEEVLFFLCIPYACMFSYHCLRVLKPDAGFNRQVTDYISWTLMIGGGVAALVYYQQQYTCATFLLLSLFTWYMKDKQWAGKFYLCYTLLLVPFTIINGILTGSWIAAPIVWYNSQEIIGLRLLTIPVEDVYYGLTLIGSQVALYEYRPAHKIQQAVELFFSNNKKLPLM
ncbi:lycopene cyclase domain-containing protein [Chitinophaga silvisoli]|uniref:Lycopene cyclase domain-containing protein n=1 Tax=Chitinophaga silvisoli TaxID=2291814 RepID=A0A3E1NUA8_9BACT|nr:lycopene cyclase domain-containing protein [Chitinophaga silvisoli]RFM31535.1 lycopene cyclase domain-containing protein [Chitinophaga silvisoli]